MQNDGDFTSLLEHTPSDSPPSPPYLPVRLLPSEQAHLDEYRVLGERLECGARESEKGSAPTRRSPCLETNGSASEAGAASIINSYSFIMNSLYLDTSLWTGARVGVV